ncbi:hypothetical protein PENCOP_c013G00197 [Penicillium coprophilum]|uniref:Uncharacterized protein n=1 Tax=Penicillium coprophilum TaxID=36646 RepID=A0A1V6UB83_9EURO|nr:hypothetical protein PENCOP_c013G00197 [Penicillium coprophilum]
MNTIRSTWFGWGTLCLAGGGAYYFAKQSINADRQARFEAEVKRKAQMKRMEDEHKRQAHVPPKGTPGNTSLKQVSFQNVEDNAASPSLEASHDPAPTRHEPLTEAELVSEKGKYETAQPYRPPSGNRFS